MSSAKLAADIGVINLLVKDDHTSSTLCRRETLSLPVVFCAFGIGLFLLTPAHDGNQGAHARTNFRIGEPRWRSGGAGAYKYSYCGLLVVYLYYQILYI